MKEFFENLTTLEWVLIWTILVLMGINSILKSINTMQKIKLKKRQLKIEEEKRRQG